MEQMNLFNNDWDSKGQKLYDVEIFDEKSLQELSVGTSSKGNQEKWYDSDRQLFIKGAFYYEDTYWKDYQVECLASALAQQMPLGEIRVVAQQHCLIQKRNKTINGVFSKDFRANPSQIFIPYNRLLKLHDKEDIVIGFPGKRFDIIVKSMQEFTGLDITEYLIVMIILDFLVGNEDRHLNNFGVILDGNDYKLAPLFDFGLGLFEHDNIYKNKTLEQAIDLMQAKPFCANPVGIINWLKKNHTSKLYSFLPKAFNVKGIRFPSQLAKDYLMWACNELGVILYD